VYLKKIILVMAIGVAGLAVLETLFFIWTLNRPSVTSQYDALVVFAGSSNRIQSTYELARQGAAPVLIISPASRRIINYYEKRFGPPGKATYIIEEQADTTFANALHVARLIRTHRLTSVLLITSDYHMPRSYFLLKLATLTAGCHVGMHKLDTRAAEPMTWQTRMTRLKLTYNEMVQLWGSLAEGGLYVLGQPDTWLKKRSSGVTRWLRELLLFDVGCPDCG
jgi:uncharacterized SAM-binding protein YcdF (DUF218 family)